MNKPINGEAVIGHALWQKIQTHIALGQKVCAVNLLLKNGLTHSWATQYVEFYAKK